MSGVGQNTTKDAKTGMMSCELRRRSVMEHVSGLFSGRGRLSPVSISPFWRLDITMGNGHIFQNKWAPNTVLNSMSSLYFAAFLYKQA